MTNNTYLQKLAKRKFDESLKNNLIFGLTLGWVLTLMGAFKCFILLERGWMAGMVVGLALLFTSLVIPQALEGPQELIKKVGGFVATNLFRVLLAFVYFVAIMPVGLIYQATKGKAPFYAWEGTAPATIEGWVPKKCTDEGALVAGQSRKQNAFLQPLQVLGYFASHGEMLFMPALILFLVMGVLGVFAQTTGLAPLIYTLF
jgi:hypothetical protein